MNDSLWEVRCAECDRIIAFTGSQPYGYMICPDCNNIRNWYNIEQETLSPLLDYHYGKIGMMCCSGQGRMLGKDVPPPTCEHGNLIHWHT